MNFSANLLNRTSESVLQRIAEGDRTAIKDCIDLHGNLVWALARKLSDSFEEAEILAQEIFIDIWKCAERFNSIECNESTFIQLIACQKYSKRAKQIIN